MGTRNICYCLVYFLAEQQTRQRNPRLTVFQAQTWLYRFICDFYNTAMWNKSRGKLATSYFELIPNTQHASVIKYSPARLISGLGDKPDYIDSMPENSLFLQRCV